MADPVPHQPLEFDVREVNEAADRIKRPGPYISGAGVAMMLLFSVLFILSDWMRIANRTISADQLAGAVAIWAVTAMICWLGIPAILRGRRGISLVRLSDTEIELTYPDGRSVAWGWNSPCLRFDLREWSDDPEKSILIDGRESALTPAAYSAILSVAETMHLIVGTDRGYWTIPSSIRPFVRHVRGGHAVSRAVPP
jgi:hypothetical protein